MFNAKCFAILASSALLSAYSYAATSLPVVEILGSKYYMYQSQKGDSLFGISRQFGWDIDLLQKLNPNAVSPLPKGVNIYYPAIVEEAVATTTIDPASLIASSNFPANPEFYTIKRGDTLYSVARSHNTTVAEIMKLNPGVSETNFKADSRIKLPSAGSGLSTQSVTVTEQRVESFGSYTVGKDESWSGIARRTGVPVDKLKAANPGVSELKNKTVLTIPNLEDYTVEQHTVAIDPREESRDGIRDIYEEVHGIADSSNDYVVKAAVVLAEPMSKKDAEYTRGFLTAVDNLKRNKVKYDIKFIDGTESSASIISSLDEYKPAIVFTTAEKNIPSYLGEYAQVSMTPVVNVFDVKSTLFEENPYIIQLLATSADFNDGIASYIKDNYAGYDLVFVGQEDADDQLASALRSLWSATSTTAVPVEYLSDYTVTDNSKILFYGNPTRKSDVSDILDKIVALREANPLAEIETIGRPNWIVFDESLSRQLHNAATLIPSRFYYDPDSSDARIFSLNYKKLFNQTPAKSFPMYAPLGYDNALFFLQGLGNSLGDVNSLGVSTGTVQSDYSLKRIGNWMGLINPVVYLVRFNPYDTTDKIKVGL